MLSNLSTQLQTNFRQFVHHQRHRRPDSDQATLRNRRQRHRHPQHKKRNNPAARQPERTTRQEHRELYHSLRAHLRLGLCQQLEKRQTRHWLPSAANPRDNRLGLLHSFRLTSYHRALLRSALRSICLVVSAAESPLCQLDAAQRQPGQLAVY